MRHMTGEVRLIRYAGSVAGADALVEMLERRGVEVDWRLPIEYRARDGDADDVVIQMLAAGGYDEIKGAAMQLLERFHHAEVEIEHDGLGPDDGGFLG